MDRTKHLPSAGQEALPSSEQIGDRSRVAILRDLYRQKLTPVSVRESLSNRFGQWAISLSLPRHTVRSTFFTVTAVAVPLLLDPSLWPLLIVLSIVLSVLVAVRVRPSARAAFDFDTLQEFEAFLSRAAVSRRVRRVAASTFVGAVSAELFALSVVALGVATLSGLTSRWLETAVSWGWLRRTLPAEDLWPLALACLIGGTFLFVGALGHLFAGLRLWRTARRAEP